MKKMNDVVLWLGGLLAAITVSALVQAQGAESFPNKSLKIVVPFPAGGAADVFARLTGQKLSEVWSQPVVVENKPGAGGPIATQYVATAQPDGYTLLVVTVGHAVNPALYPKLAYDTEKDLKPVAMLANLPSILVIGPSLKVNSVQELIALARSQPGKLTYASSGNATTSHVAAAMFTSMTDIKMLHVPYKGSAPAMTDLISGQVDILIDPIATAKPHLDSGKLRALAVTTPEPSPLMPGLPTMTASGVKGYEFAAWFLLLAPSGVPDPIVNKINAEVVKMMAQPDVQKNYDNRGAVVGIGTPAELTAFLSNEIKRLGQLARDSGMKVE